MEETVTEGLIRFLEVKIGDIDNLKLNHSFTQFFASLCPLMIMSK